MLQKSARETFVRSQVVLVGLEVPYHLTDYKLKITEDVEVSGSELLTKLNACDKGFVFSDVVGGFEFKPEDILI